MSEWKPIESAPKDGTVILVCDVAHGPYPESVGSASFNDGWWWEDVGNSADPTHWMPLPDPPKDHP